MSKEIILVLATCLTILPIGWAQEFGYVPPIGPTNWSMLDPAWAICDDGIRQSPINVPTQQAEESSDIQLTIINEDLMMYGTLENNMHSIEFSIDSDTSTRPVFTAIYQRSNNFPDAVYVLQQFHFHWAADDTSGSENQIDGVSSVAELHFVTQNIRFNSSQAGAQQNGFLVLGILVRLCENSDFYPIFGANNSNLRQISYYPNNVSNISLRMQDIYSCAGACTDTNKYYVFQGSFTTPPCSEAVTWWLAEDMLCISQEQLSMLRNQMVTSTGPQLSENIRPVQARNDRTILTNTVNSATATLMNLSLTTLLLFLVLLFV